MDFLLNEGDAEPFRDGKASRAGHLDADALVFPLRESRRERIKGLVDDVYDCAADVRAVPLVDTIYHLAPVVQNDDLDGRGADVNSHPYGT